MTHDAAGLHGLLLVDKPGLVPSALGVGKALMAESGVGSSSAEAHFGAPLIEPATALPTSHDVVQQVRRLSGQRRIGHTGTLDPMASGLLVLCLGWATRLVEYYQGHAKGYRAQIMLGVATETWDALGAVTERATVPMLRAADVEAVLAGFTGAQMQTPPAYSALKQGGESLHYKARRGEAVEVAARPVTFHALTLVDFASPETITIDVRCSAGAYIRSLAVDLGRALGAPATLTGLRRTAAGGFSVAQAHSMAVLADAAARGGLADLLAAPGAGLDLLSATADDAATLTRLGQGQVLDDAALALPGGAALPDDAEPVLVYDAAGALAGIVRRTSGPAGRGWRAEKWFA